jgi:hypothetical protein
MLLIAPSLYDKPKHFVFYEDREYEVQVKDNTIHLHDNMPYALQLDLKEHFNIAEIVIHKRSSNPTITSSQDSFKRI